MKFWYKLFECEGYKFIWDEKEKIVYYFYVRDNDYRFIGNY